MAKSPRSSRGQSPDSTGSYGAAPQMLAGMAFQEQGASGLRAFSGYVREEFLPQLQGREGARVYREMADNSPVIGALLFAILGVMRKVDWRVEPADDTPQAQEMADFADGLRFDMSHTWEDFISESLSMLTYGYAPHEICYKRRIGPTKFGAKRPTSKFKDGLVGWAKLPLRGQDTILKWFFGPNGEILGLTQQPYIGPLLDVPGEKLLILRPATHKNNPEGRSILRNAYRSYFFIKRMEEQEAVLLERFSGLPILRVPNSLIEAASTGKDPQATAAYAAYKKMIVNVRIDEQMGLILPSDTFAGATGPSTTPMFDFKFETPQSGRASMDANTPIDRHKVDILVSTLCDFIQMGHTSRGAQNLAETKVDMFMQSVEGWLNSIAATINLDGLPRLWDLNGFDRDSIPEYVPNMAQRLDLDVFSNMLLRLSQAGMPMFPDPDLESYIRDTAGLPDASDDRSYGNDQREDAGVEGPHGKIVNPGTNPRNTRATPARKRMETNVRENFVRALLKQKRPA